jgi:hypothetical protein
MGICLNSTEYAFLRVSLAVHIGIPLGFLFVWWKRWWEGGRRMDLANDKNRAQLTPRTFVDMDLNLGHAARTSFRNSVLPLHQEVDFTGGGPIPGLEFQNQLEIELKECQGSS